MLKKITAAVLCLLFTVTMCGTAYAGFWSDGSDYLNTGDLNGNGKADTDDARRILRISIGLEDKQALCVAQLIAADADGDSVISTSDARNVLRIAVGLERTREGEDKSVKSIDFTLVKNEKVGCSGNVSAPTAAYIVKSPAELSAVYSANKRTSITLSESGKIETIKPSDVYNDRFFEEKSLVVLYTELSSGSYSFKVNSLCVCSHREELSLAFYKPEIGTADMAYYITVLEVDKAAVSGVESVLITTEFGHAPGME